MSSVDLWPLTVTHYLSMLSGQSTPEDKAMLKSMEAAYMIIGNLLDKMDKKQGRVYRKLHSFSNFQYPGFAQA